MAAPSLFELSEAGRGGGVSRLTVGDIFAGGGGFSLGAVAAGLEPVFAIEHDPAIAEVYAANLGNHVLVADATKVDIHKLEPVDVLLASPPCQDHSQARSKKLPKRADAEVGRCVLDYVRVLMPRFVMIENVEGWKRSRSFIEVFHGLHALGYWTNVQVLNSADFGVPQTRRRLFLRASREGFLPALPAPMPWRGWYEAIEDLIPMLPESKFADWQLARLPAEMVNLLVDSAGFDDGQGKLPVMREAKQPAGTVLSNYKHRKLRAFIVSGGNTNKSEIDSVARDGDAPAFTVATGSAGNTRAFIVDGKPKNFNGDLQVIDQAKPVVTVSASQPNHPFRAWLSQGRVVSMTPRALARFQSFPDEYKFPEGKGSNALACRVIGNAVPIKQAKQLLEAITP